MRNKRSSKIILAFFLVLIGSNIGIINAWEFDPNPLNPVDRYAVIVGMNSYQLYGQNHDYAIATANGWYHFLKYDLGWDSSKIQVYGDSDSSNYTKYSGLATKSNVVNAITQMVNSADDNDMILLTFTCDGERFDYELDGNMDYCVCLYDYVRAYETGKLFDFELIDILENTDAERIFAHFDSCNSGGFTSEFRDMNTYAHVFVSTTCTNVGIGRDGDIVTPALPMVPWSYYFLIHSWKNHYGSSKTTPIESVWLYARNAYLASGIPRDYRDYPQVYDSHFTSFIFA